jgi:hypothetical protein
MSSSSVVQRLVSDLISVGTGVTVNYFAILLVFEKGNRAPKFPSDNSLGAGDLDNKIVGACETKEFGDITVHLFGHSEIRHGVSDFICCRKQSRLSGVKPLTALLRILPDLVGADNNIAYQ